MFKPFNIIFVSGNSMYPTLHDKQLVLAIKEKPKRNNIMIFKTPEDWGFKKVIFVKRVLGVPGDKIKLSHQSVYINDNLIVHIPDKYKDSHISDDEEREYILKDKEYLMVGDNIGNSHDGLVRFFMGEENFVTTEDTLVYTIKGGHFAKIISFN